MPRILESKIACGGYEQFYLENGIREFDVSFPRSINDVDPSHCVKNLS